MKTKLTLAILSSFLFNCISAQTVQTCTTETFSSETAGWTYSQGAHVGNYNNPVTGCSDDRGIITPGVGGNNPCNIQTPQYISTGAITVDLTFDMIVLNANLKCNTWKDYPCQTSVDVFYYVGSTKYTAIIDMVLPPNGPGNSTNVFVSFNPGNNLPVGTAYKIEMCFKPKSGVGNCIQQNTKYVFDNFRNCETANRNYPANERMTNQNNQDNDPISFTAYTNTKNKATKLTVNADPDTKVINLVNRNGKILRSASGISFIVFDIKGMDRGQYFVQFEKNNGEKINKPVMIN